MILNRNLCGLESIINSHWNKFSLVLCADGGANRLYDITAGGAEREAHIPHIICGDLDSVQSSVLQFYHERGCRVVRVEDQDTTDFYKTLRELLNLRQMKLAQFSAVYALNGMGGRFDQTLSNVQTMMTFQRELEDTPLYLLSEDSVTVQLPSGDSRIIVNSGLERGECGLLPIGEPCHSCTTSGLQWNLSNHALKFRGLISTSNQLLSDHPPVTVTLSSPVIWTMSHTLCSNHQ